MSALGLLALRHNIIKPRWTRVWITQKAPPTLQARGATSCRCVRTPPRRTSDASLDFCFIDADHSYEGCRADIKSYLPKMKTGGWLSGHDYDHPNYPMFGVKKAVDEFVSERSVPLELGLNFTWFVRIP